MENSALRRWGASALTVAFILVMAACTPSDDGARGNAEAPEAQAVPVEVDTGPGEFDLADTRVGLGELSGYRATLTVAFDGTNTGQSQQWSSTYEMTQTRDPMARQLTIQQTGIASEGDPQLPEYLAEKDGASYERLAGGSCTANVINPENTLMDLLEPARNLRTVFGAEAAGHESVNGIEAEKYAFDERALLRKGLSEASGEMWVAPEGSYIVRYLLTAKGDAEFFGEGVEGTMTWKYELTEAGQPIPIELPADCPSGLVSAPMLPGAAIAQNLPGVLQYETATGVPEARAFYEAELAKLGWTPPVSAVVPEGMSADEYQRAMELLKGMGMNQPTPAPNPDQAYLRYSRGEEELDLVITRGDASTSVLIILSRAGK